MNVLDSKTISVLRNLWPETRHDRWMTSKFEDGLISVIIPTYNRDQFLGAAMNSVWRQSYRPIELLVVDDGSTDNTPTLVDERTASYSSDSRFTTRYFRQVQSGACAARNLGLIESHGEFLTLLDSDDLLHPQKLEVQKKSLQESPCSDFAWSNRIAFNNRDPVETEHLSISEAVQAAETEIHRYPPATYPQAALFPRAICEALGPWNEKLDRWQDWDYSFRVALCAFAAIRTGDFYYHRNHKSESIGDLRFRPEGVIANLKALQSMEKTFEHMDQSDPTLNRIFRNLYVSTFRVALRVGTEEQIQRCLRGAKRHSQGLPSRLKLAAMTGIHRIAGRKAALAVLNGRSRAANERAK